MVCAVVGFAAEHCHYRWLPVLCWVEDRAGGCKTRGLQHGTCAGWHQAVACVVVCINDSTCSAYLCEQSWVFYP
jgi:hypothetical protein